MNPPDSDLVCLIVPGEASTIITSDGESHLVKIDEAGRRFVWIKSAFARSMLNSGLPCCIQWREANATLAEALGHPPKPTPGIATF
jgi:hypothetical protein